MFYFENDIKRRVFMKPGQNSKMSKYNKKGSRELDKQQLVKDIKIELEAIQETKKRCKENEMKIKGLKMETDQIQLE